MKPKLISCEIFNSMHTGGGSAGKALVGGVLFGPVGAIVGAAGKGKNKVTFKLTYDNGKIEYPSCDEGSFTYKIYLDIIKKLDAEKL